ncbi:MAG: hypothetical protein ACW9W3_01090 [Candidatus Nitrosopumilus sp. bin_68KS]
MVEVPLSWRLEVKGAEQVKSKLSEINSQFQRGEISASDYGKSLREVRRDANVFTGISSLQNKIFLAQHPLINRLSKVGSTLSSVTRTLLSIQNAWNLATIASQGISSQLVDAQSDQARSQRLINKLTSESKQGTEEYARAQEDLAIATARVAEIMNDEKFQTFSNFTTQLLSATGAIATITATLRTFGVSLAGIASSVGFLVTGIGAAFAGTPIADWIVSQIPALQDFRDNYLKPILDTFFTQTIPQALGSAAEFLANFFLNDLPNWGLSGLTLLHGAFVATWNSIIQATEGFVNNALSGIESFINSVIRAINRAISGLNKLPGVSIGHISSVSLGRVSIPTIAAANGFEGMVNNPTNFMVAENSPEYVSVTPLSKQPSTGITMNITVQGSILSERQLQKVVSDGLKSRLKQRGNYQFI